MWFLKPRSETSGWALIFQSMDFNRWLMSQIKDRKPADKIGAKECQRCGCCCVRGPCGLDKEDVPKLAKFLDVSIQELFDKYLVVDGSDPKFYLRPRRSGQSGGHYLTCSETYERSACVFFKDGQPGECTMLIRFTHSTESIGIKR